MTLGWIRQICEPLTLNLSNLGMACIPSDPWAPDTAGCVRTVGEKHSPERGKGMTTTPGLVP